MAASDTTYWARRRIRADSALLLVGEKITPDSVPKTSCDESYDDNLLLLLAEEDDIEGERQEAAARCRAKHLAFNSSLTDSAMWKVNFRFTREQVDVLTRLLRLPDTFRTSSRHRASGTQGLCILLRRLAYSHRLSDMQQFFGRDETVILIIGNGVLEHVYSKFAHLLGFDCSRLTPLKLQAFTDAVNQKGAPLRCCVSFIDETVGGVCHPSENQQFVYSGHKRKDAVKYQSVVTPDGIIVHLYGPLSGGRHDLYLLAKSNLVKKACPALTGEGKHFILYGDPAYGRQQYILAPHKEAQLTAEEALFNAQMSRVRVCAEWGFGWLVRNWAFFDYSKNQKLYLQPVGHMYAASAILTNILEYMNGNETTDFFGVQPPTACEYLHVRD